jgi:hypothetical protein
MQVPSKATVETAGLEVTDEACGALADEGKGFILWASVWIIALAILLPALI